MPRNAYRWVGRTHWPERYGQPCDVLCHGRGRFHRTKLVRFDDGTMVTAIGRVRRERRDA